MMALVGLTYAELVSAMPSAGGEHDYVLRGLGSRVGVRDLVEPGAGLRLRRRLRGGRAAADDALPVPGHARRPALDRRRLRRLASWVAVGVLGALLMTGLNYRGVRPAAVFQGAAVLFLLAVGACC